MTRKRSRGIISHIPEGMHTRSQVAALIGRSPDTVRRWHTSGLFVPKESKRFGKNTVWLYTDDDVKALRKLAKVTHAGRPKGSTNGSAIDVR